ncbi:MAG: hypothetical protein KC543_14660, partial [Myxococcales bacterium]|nr:hypothetical protein [Myxococcales bacterium]
RASAREAAGAALFQLAVSGTLPRDVALPAPCPPLVSLAPRAVWLPGPSQRVELVAPGGVRCDGDAVDPRESAAAAALTEVAEAFLLCAPLPDPAFAEVAPRRVAPHPDTASMLSEGDALLERALPAVHADIRRALVEVGLLDEADEAGPDVASDPRAVGAACIRRPRDAADAARLLAVATAEQKLHALLQVDPVLLGAPEDLAAAVPALRAAHRALPLVALARAARAMGLDPERSFERAVEGTLDPALRAYDEVRADLRWTPVGAGVRDEIARVRAER